MLQSPRSFHLSAAGPWFAGLLLLALITFWPSYLSLPRSASSTYTHFHALTATLWMLLLISQPILVRGGRMRLHRTLGKVAWVLGPVFIVAALLLAHSRIVGIDGERYAIQTYVLWLQISLTSVFALCWALAMTWRRQMAVHARFMVGTALTLIDPIVIRSLNWIDNAPAFNYQWLTFGLTDLVLIALIAIERKAPTGRWVFPFLLVVFVLSQIPALFGWTRQPWWQAFSAWYAGLPLT